MYGIQKETPAHNGNINMQLFTGVYYAEKNVSLLKVKRCIFRHKKVALTH